MIEIYDISPALRPGMPVWPGDVAFSRAESLRIRDGDTVTLSSIECSLHTGAHADAPAHFLENGTTIDCVDLSVYVGLALLTTLQSGIGPILSEELVSVLETRPERLLVRAHADLDPEVFPREIRYFSEKAAATVGVAGIRLLGTDGPSVDALDSKDLPAHHMLGRYSVAILENLRFGDVPDGVYELIALPLPIVGADASPVRAVLRAMDPPKRHPAGIE